MTHLVLVGPMGSGKSTLANVLARDYDFRYWPSFTTRPPRKGEINGEDYIFVTDEEFVQYADADDVTAIREYFTKEGTWLYGFPLRDLPDTDTVSIVDPQGLFALHGQLPDLFAVYLDPPEDIRRYRVIVRGDDPEEIDRRFGADNMDFAQLNTCFQRYCKLRLAKKRTPEANAERIIQGIEAYRTGALS